jgi:hypothetical protein
VAAVNIPTTQNLGKRCHDNSDTTGKKKIKVDFRAPRLNEAAGTPLHEYDAQRPLVATSAPTDAPAKHSHHKTMQRSTTYQPANLLQHHLSIYNRGTQLYEGLTGASLCQALPSSQLNAIAVHFALPSSGIDVTRNYM